MHGFRLLRIWLSTINAEFFIESGGIGGILRLLIDSLALIMPQSRFLTIRRAIYDATKRYTRRRKLNWKLKRRKAIQHSEIGKHDKQDQSHN